MELAGHTSKTVLRFPRGSSREIKLFVELEIEFLVLEVILKRGQVLPAYLAKKEDALGCPFFINAVWI